MQMFLKDFERKNERKQEKIQKKTTRMIHRCEKILYKTWTT